MTNRTCGLVAEIMQSMSFVIKKKAELCAPLLGIDNIFEFPFLTNSLKIHPDDIEGMLKKRIFKVQDRNTVKCLECYNVKQFECYKK